ncbi:hypothetical protein Cyast_0047 [Cyanobacterium stanieri PCC 7202]|uniref:Uncharacterized protein n=1 Tax=Cyanobacterium stanieri (strain ATCC 29140 / PCC 7202) TaxID=292563 RepID=K9YGE4_CYASC|nr:hypothetical protein Cyast_0047 [Cyanobacterium stanieri PCC 7202]
MPSSTHFQTLINYISTQVENQLRQNKSNQFDDPLFYAIQFWYYYLSHNQNLNFTNEVKEYIVEKYKNQKVRCFILNREKEWRTIFERKKTNLFGITEIVKSRTRFYSLIDEGLKLLKIENTYMNFIVIFAFVIVAVLFVSYFLNQPKQTTQTKDIEESNRPTNQSYQTTTVEYTAQKPVKQISQQSLILVIPFAKSKLIDSLIKKGNTIITDKNYSNLYDSARYLYLDFSENLDNLLSKIKNNYICEDLDSDIYLVQINLKQPDEGLKANVNPNTRINAFKRLIDLEAKVLGRFPLEAYENMNVYDI